jgi:hypothetical protein
LDHKPQEIIYFRLQFKLKSKPLDESQRFPLTGTIDQIGSDIQKIKSMGVDHIIFGYNFVPIGRGVTEMIDTSKQLSKFAR